MHKVKKFWEDSINIIPFILCLIALLLISCFLFEKRYPNLSILTQFSSFSFMFFGLLYLIITILHAKRPERFDDKYSSIKAFLTPSLPKAEPKTSLFLATLNHFFLFVVGLAGAILGCWLVHLLDAVGACVVLMMQVFLVFISLRGDKKIILILGLIILCGAPIVVFFQGAYYISAAGAGFISSLTYLAKRKHSMHWLKDLHKYESGIADLVFKFYNLCRNAYSLVYENATKVNFRALIISIFLILYFAGKNIIILFPPEIKKYSQDFEYYLEQVKPLIPYAVCLLYCLFSFVPIVKHLVKPFSFKDESSSVKLFVNLLITFFINLCLGPIIFIPVFL